jgi:PAS domain S-box-containing protein
MNLQDKPVVAIDDNSIFFYCNKAFTDEFGWTEAELLGEPVTKIMPAHMRSAHNIGLSRFLTTEESELLGKPLPLEVLYKNGDVKVADHFIVGHKENGAWRFAAIIDYPKA